MKHWIFLALFALGLLHAVYSSLPILDPSSSLFNNDEGYFLNNGLNAIILSDLRYGLFSLLVKSYFLVVGDPFWVVVFHKSLLLTFFFLLQLLLVREYGYKVFILLYSSFIFLNGFFLRESLIFLFVLLALYFSNTGRSTGNYVSLIGLALTRPQGLMLFLRPWVSLLILLTFLLFLRPQYAVVQVPDNGFLTLINGEFWKFVFAKVLTTLANLNPLASFMFHSAEGDYLQLIVSILGSIAMFVVFAQMVLASGWRQYRHAYLFKLCSGMIFLLVIYGAIGMAADKRIFLSLFSPFVIFINPSFLQLRNLFLLLVVWIFMLIIGVFL
ncbi:MAG: hypothetical protein ACOVQB_08840 [Polynucleobacter sp.]